MESSKAASRQIVLDPKYDDARPHCLLCNPDPHRRYVMKRVKVIGELERPRWKYAQSTISNELCEHCIEEFDVWGKLNAYQDHEEAKRVARLDRQYRRLVENPCEICGHHFDTEEDLDRGHCGYCSSSFDEHVLLEYAIEHSGTIHFFRTEGDDVVLRLTLLDLRMDFVAESGFTTRFWAKVRRTIRERLPQLPETRTELSARAWAERQDRRLLGTG